MDIGSVNHEVDFCKVYDMETKEKVERILLKNGISFLRNGKKKGWAACSFSVNPKKKPPVSSASTAMKYPKPKNFSNQCLELKHKDARHGGLSLCSIKQTGGND